MKLVKIVIIAFCLLAASASNSVFANTESLFNDVYKKVDSYLAIVDNYKKANKDTWYPQPFTKTKGSLEKDLNKLLDATLECLLDDRLVKLKYEINNLKKSNEKLSESIADLKMRRIGAPADKKMYELWKDSIDDIDKKIAGYESEIPANLNKIEQCKQKMLFLLREEGLEISKDSINGLIEPVTADETIKSIAALKNIHVILEKLQIVLKEKNENIAIAKKYYGLFLLATQTYLHQLDTFINRINNNYMPKLNQIRKENNILMAKTQSNLNRDPKYSSNLNAQKLTEETAKKYERLLSKQKAQLTERIKKTHYILELSFNTYETVSLASRLNDMLKDSISGYDELMALPLIEPVHFENKEMLEKFSDITKRLEQ